MYFLNLQTPKEHAGIMEVQQEEIYEGVGSFRLEMQENIVISTSLKTCR